MNTYKQTFCWEKPFIIILSILPFFTYSLSQINKPFYGFEHYYQKAQEDTLSIENRKRFLKISFTLLSHTKKDSVKYYRVSKIIDASSRLNDSIFYKDMVTEGFKLAKSLNKPALLADAHWNYGSYYLKEKKYDSSYYHYDSAHKFYTSANNTYYAGKMLYNMAYIASETNDFTGAEILLFRSIKIFETTNKTLPRYRSYNLLGTIADNMEEYEKSLTYYNKATELISHLERSRYYQMENWNNLGVRLTKMEQFAEAIPYFEKALAYSDSITEKTSLYAKLLDNKAFCLVSLGKYDNVKDPMEYAMIIRDSLDDITGAVVSRLRFAIYYGKIGDTLSAIAYAKNALKLAKKNFVTREVLNSLEQLAKLDKAQTVFYLQQHVELNKSLNARDRNLRNKFTAIQFETEAYIRENEMLFRQRLWILIVAIASTIILFLIYFNTRQRAKNKELEFERDQQQYNEDMFLMALSEKTNLEKGKAEERQRISQELHDGIVSRLFTLRFRWQSVILSGESKMLSRHREFLDLLEVLETDIRNLSHDLRSVIFFREENFINTIETIIKEKREVGAFTCDFICLHPVDWEELSYIAKINIRRLVEEILQNVIKHAQAENVKIDFFRDLDILNIVIADDGKGFAPNQIRKGIGIRNLENRSRKLKGNFEVKSTLNMGTRISIKFPLNS